MKNNALINDLKELTSNKANISDVSTSVIGGKFTIEVSEIEPQAYSSYVYKKVGDRDTDFNKLTELLKK